MSGKVSPVLLLLGALVLAGLFLGLFAIMYRPAPPAVPLPTPNAYDTLQQAGRMVRGLPDDYADTTDQEKLASFLAKNASAFELATRAISQPSAVPLERQSNMQMVLNEIDPLRQALRLVHAAARAAELEGNRAREAEQYARLFVLSNKSAHGGLLVNAMVALAYEDPALRRLNDIAAELSSEEKQQVLTLLESVGRQAADLNQILARDRAQVEKELGPVRVWILRMTTGDSGRAANQRFVQRDAEVVKLYNEVVQKLRP